MIKFSGFAHLLENPGKSLIYFLPCKQLC